MKEKIVFDLETTGLDPNNDEILQVSIINGDGEELLNSYVRPVHVLAWPEAQHIHGITPDMVQTAPVFDELRPRIQEIFDGAQELIAYNGTFDMGFLRTAGIKIPSVPYYDVMHEFSPIYGEWSDYFGDYKWQKLLFHYRKSTKRY